MKKNFLVAFLSIFFFCGYSLFGTDYKGSKTTVSYVMPIGNPYFAWGSQGEDIGYNRPSGADAEIARTKYAFDFSNIPSNAIITNVSLSYSITNNVNGGYKFRITKISNQTTPQSIWEGISQGNVLFQDLDYSGRNLTSSDLTTWVNDNKSNSAYLGAYSQNESSTDSRANVDITISLTFTVPPSNVTITADNNFTAPNGTHGKISVDGNSNLDAPYTFSRNSGVSVTLQAVSPQTDNAGYQRIWHTGSVYPSEWQKNSIPSGNDQTKTFAVSTSDDHATYQAQLRKLCSITFQNNFGSNGNGGSITVNGSQYGSPASGFPVVEQNPITAAAIDQTVNGVQYDFSGWSNGSTSRTTTFYPTDNTPITANFVRHVSVQISGPVDIHYGTNYTWTANAGNGFSPYSYQWYYLYPSNILYSPNTIRPNLPPRDVWYTIGTNSPTLVTAFPAYDDINLKCVVTDSHNYVVTSNILDIYSGVAKRSADESPLTEYKIPTQYNLFQNHPNPFNPTTVIQYQLPQNGLVTLKVYDIVGNEVKTLVNGYHSAGSYTVNFDATNLPSGIYFYQLKAGNFIATKKLLLLK